MMSLCLNSKTPPIEIVGGDSALPQFIDHGDNAGPCTMFQRDDQLQHQPGSVNCDASAQESLDVVDLDLQKYSSLIRRKRMF
ncbi:hypothetical protein MIR68_011919 [Amoeboaphelidium protococcarum]|nr:hypothetical protein MIR68_011919 [Amoeboaphelidium protococcarum]